jgi:hypothetical protein
MSSTAISAQGTVVSIGTGSGGAKTITGVAVGFPTILTSSAHGFNNGDYVTFSGGFTGADAATLNSLAFVVKNVTTNTFAVQADSTGKTITAGTATATPTTFTAIANVKDFTGLDGSASEIDVTNLDSTAKEFRLGLTDPGQFSMNIDYDDANAGHQALRAKQISGVLTPFKVLFLNADVITFSGYVKKMTLTGGVDQVAKTAVDIRISGPVTGFAA